MITEIKTLADVEAFAKYLLTEEKLSFHPDDDFNDYVKINTNTPAYTPDEAFIRNNLMNRCFEICEHEGVEIYEVMGKPMYEYWEIVPEV